MSLILLFFLLSSQFTSEPTSSVSIAAVSSPEWQLCIDLNMNTKQVLELCFSIYFF